MSSKLVTLKILRPVVVVVAVGEVSEVGEDEVGPITLPLPRRK